jgi:hypothetical protein
MKKIKINVSKTSWIILSVGVFIVILAGLGVTYSSQLKENSEANDELAVTEARLGQFNIEELQQQENELIAIHDFISSQHDSGKLKLQQPVESIDVIDKCYYIASLSNVKIYDIGTTDIKTQEFINLQCEKIIMYVIVHGELSDMVNFIINMNEGFSTGYIESIQMVMDDSPYTSIQMVVYSYKGD